MKYWHKDDDVTSDVSQEAFVPPYDQARSVDIEMTSYGLLTYIRRQNLPGGLPIAKWIIAQRNADGGFSSTQVRNLAGQVNAQSVKPRPQCLSVKFDLLS